MNKELIMALDALEKENGIDKEIMFAAIEKSLMDEYKAEFDKADNGRVELDRRTGDFHIYSDRTVVEEVIVPENRENKKEKYVSGTDISLEDARKIKPDCQLGDVITVEVKSEEFSRKAAKNAKNTIVLLDYALTSSDRRILARKTKTDMSGKVFAVIDRVILVFLAKHYSETAINRMLMSIIMPFASYQPYIDKSADVMPPEIFIGRKYELEKIESPTGVNIVYGGRQLGKSALLRMARKDIDHDENGDRAILVDIKGNDYKAAAKKISAALFDEGILKEEHITDDWSELARDIKKCLRSSTDYIPYLLLLMDEADVFIESCESVGYRPFDALKDIQSIGSGRFKFVVAGLRNIVRFKREVALGNNSVLTHLESLTVKPFKSMEARELLEVALSYLGFRFPKDNDTEVLISTIFGTTNYFPGLLQLYCAKLIEAMRRDYAGYSESETPPYIVKKDHIKKVLAEQSLQQDIREKFFITLKVGEDDYYYIIALLVAYYYHGNKSQNGCSASDLIELADTYSIGKISAINSESLAALMEEMCELNVLQHTGDGRYRFTRHSFCQMMGTVQQIEDELMNYMED